MHRLALLLLLAVTCAACAPDDPPAVVAPLVGDSASLLIELPLEVAPGSATPALFAGADNSVFVSWTEPSGAGRHALRYARLEGDQWSVPLTAAEGADWFVNWADIPSLAASGDTVVVHYLVKSGPGTYAYDVHVRRSVDGGRSWEAPVPAHRDGTETEHGFVSMLPLTSGQVQLVWLDGRALAAGASDAAGQGASNAAMSLRAARLGSGGAIEEERVLDERVCDCCRTAAVPVPGGQVVFYRNRTDDERRDIWYVRSEDGQWFLPAPVHEDNWQIQGCPVNGPAADSRADTVAVAWFTAAQDQPHVKVAFSVDGGRSFGAPVLVDGGRPLGRTEVALLPGGGAVVAWLEGVGDGGDAEIRARTVSVDGRLGESHVLTRTSGARASGFPGLAATPDGRLFLAWTDPEGGRIRTARLTLP